MAIVPLALGDLAEIVGVYADAFHDYPVMRFTLGDRGDYDRRLSRLVELFVAGRAYRGEPMFGIRDATGLLIGAATMSIPKPVDGPAEFLLLREDIWKELGAEERQRYEAFSTATQRIELPSPHMHLNMIGVRQSHQGQGLARRLLEQAHQLSHGNESRGTSLTTELERNVRLYEHFGYEVRGHVRVDDALETWVLFRENERPPRDT